MKDFLFAVLFALSAVIVGVCAVVFYVAVIGGIFGVLFGAAYYVFKLITGA